MNTIIVQLKILITCTFNFVKFYYPDRIIKIAYTNKYYEIIITEFAHNNCVAVIHCYVPRNIIELQKLM